MKELSDREEFVMILARETDEFTTRTLAPWLMTQARRLHTLYEGACNGDLTERQRKSMQQTEMRVQANLNGDGAYKQWGMSATFNNDPRGGSIYLKVPSGRTNDIGERGIYVPYR